MALLKNIATGDDEPTDFDAEGDPFDYLYCTQCQRTHPCDDERIYSDCSWALDQMDMSADALVYDWADAWDAAADLAEEREESER